MHSFKRTRCFASFLLIVVLFHILICVDARIRFKSFGRSRRPVVSRPIFRRPVVRPPIIRPPIIRPPKPPSSPRKTISNHIPAKRPPIVHQPISRPPAIRPPVIKPPVLRPQPPISSGGKTSSTKFLQAEGGGHSKPSGQVTTNHLPHSSPPKPTLNKPVVPPKPDPASAMVLYKRPSTSQSISSIKPSSSSHPSTAVTHQNTVPKPSTPLKTPSSITTPYKPPQTSQVKPIQGHPEHKPLPQAPVSSQGSKITGQSRPLITAKPSAPEERITKISTTNVQSASKPQSAPSGHNYPAWANPALRPQASGLVSSHSSPSSGKLSTKPLTSSSSLKPYKMVQSKLNEEKLIKPAGVKPLENSKPNTKISQSTSGSSSLIKPSKPNAVKPENTGSSTSSHGHPDHKPLPQTPSTASQGATSTSSQHHATPINEPAISNTHVSSATSSANSHHEIPSAPITSTSQLHSSYPGAGHPHSSYPGAGHSNSPNAGAGQAPIQIVNVGMGPNGGSGMGNYGGSGMGGNGGMGGGLGRMAVESVVHSLVSEGVHKLINPSQSNFNYATVPMNPDQIQPAQVPAAAPSAPSEGTTTVHNNYYVDPNTVNSATQGQGQPQVAPVPTNQGQPNYVDPANIPYQNPISTGTQSSGLDSGNVYLPQGGEQNGNLPPGVEQNGNLPPGVEQNGNLPPGDEHKGNLPPGGEHNGNLPPGDEHNGNLPLGNEHNENLPLGNEHNENLPLGNEHNENLTPADEHNGNLPPGDEHNGNLPPADEHNGNLPPADEHNGNLPPADEHNGNLPPGDEHNGNLPLGDEQNGKLPPGDEQNGNLPPADEEIGNLPPGDEQNGNLPLGDEQNRNLPPGNEQNGNLPPPGDEQIFVEVVPVDNSELWNLTETIFAHEFNISQYIDLNLQASQFDSVTTIAATEPLINLQEEAKLLPSIKAIRDLFDNYEADPTKIEKVDAEKEGALLDEFLKTDAMMMVMKFLQDRNYIAPNQWKETLHQLWMRKYENTMSGFERIFLAEKSSDPQIFGGQNWIYFDHQEQSKRIKYMNYGNSLNLGDVAQLLKVNFQFDNVEQMGKAMLVGTSPHLEMALYTVCHYVRMNDWCTVSLADTKFGINTHAWLYEGKEMLDVGFIDF